MEACEEGLMLTFDTTLALCMLPLFFSLRFCFTHFCCFVTIYFMTVENKVVGMDARKWRHDY